MLFGRKKKIENPRNILAIEDDPTFQKFISTVLGKRGHNVTISENGEKGLELARSKNFDLIILDEVLPDIRGAEICRRLKFDEKYKSLPVLFLTAGNSFSDILEHFELEAVNHLTKPINAKELISQVEGAFE